MFVAVSARAALGPGLVYAPPTGAGADLDGLPAEPVVGSALLFVAMPAYFVSLLFGTGTLPESRGVRGIAAYLAEPGALSYAGDPFFLYENFPSPGSPYHTARSRFSRWAF